MLREREPRNAASNGKRLIDIVRSNTKQHTTAMNYYNII